MRKKVLLLVATLLFIGVLALPSLATTCYTENGKTGTVYLYYDGTSSNIYGDYAVVDLNGNKFVPSVLWADKTATVLPMDIKGKVFHPQDANGNYIFDENADNNIIIAIMLRNQLYQDKLAKLTQQQKPVIRQTATATQEDDSDYEVPMSERPPGTEDWIWSKAKPQGVERKLDNALSEIRKLKRGW